VTKASLLIIDDEPAICRLIRRAGEACGYRVAIAVDQDSFELCLSIDPPTVICLDLAMPGADGIELLRLLAARRCKARIMIISGYASAMVGTAVRLGEALGLNIAPVLLKPIRIAELRALLLDLDGRSAHPDLPAAA
jgi:CheY-like chemotaxis protein